ncbi:hypothetical protein L7F22_052001 [Adiantum nelumboides]|nr:hypothetical protein [Adiantum nelumboides]
MSLSESPPSDQMLRFQLWSSSVKEDFWHRLAALKLDALHLDDTPLKIEGYFAPSLHEHYLQLRFESFPSDSKNESDSTADHNFRQCRLPGTLYNTNKKEEFFALDKRALLNKEAKKLWDDIRSGLQPASQHFNAEETAGISAACETWRGSAQSRDKPFFLLHMSNESVAARPISDWADCQQDGKVVVAFYDPCQDSSFPGWPLRNLLMLAAVHWHRQTLQVLCYREKKGQADLERSLLGDIQVLEYSVMRHGAGPSAAQLSQENDNQPAEQSSENLQKTRLGCYFCNDVVAPEDSTVNRTLDQQCTVTRPGIAPIAAALAVELAVNLLHNPSRISAPADNGVSTNVEPLGALPHQIRGFAANFLQLLITGTAFSKCTACSPCVVAEYRSGGFNFLLSVFNHPTYLEDLTGLTDLINATKDISIDWDD